jgi:hypothetical protein
MTVDHDATAIKYLSDPAGTRPFSQPALALDQAEGDRRGEATRLNNIGSDYNALGQHDQHPTTTNKLGGSPTGG